MEKLFLMRWNPAISSYKLEVYRRNCEEFPNGFRIDWSVWDYRKANCGDRFVMMRVGDYKPGIVFYGTFVSDPYTDDDWAGTDKKRRYVLMDCFGFQEGDEPIISAETLQSVMPGIDWMHGHSGVVLTEDAEEVLTQLLEEKIPRLSFAGDSIPDEEEFEASEKIPHMMQIFASLNPSVHTRNEEGYDWLESDEDWSRCLLIPNPNHGGEDMEIETRGEFILYFAGTHAHFANDTYGYESLLATVEKIGVNEECAYSCEYEGWCWCSGISAIKPNAGDVKDFLKSDDEYHIRMLGEYTEREIKGDGMLTVGLRFFDPSKNKSFSFPLSELTEKVDQYRARQKEVTKNCPHGATPP